MLAPFGRDSRMLQAILERSGIASADSCDMAALCAEFPRGAAGLIITEEALTSATIEELLVCLDSQEPWSDAPLIVLVSGGSGTQHATHVVNALGHHANVTYVERPVRPTTLLSAVESMRRARNRQYEVRDLIRAHAEAEERERSARAEAEAAVGMRDEFLGVASHELRTPLTVVMGYAEMLAARVKRGTLDSTRAERFLDDLLVHARRLNSLVDDLLDTSRIQQGRLLLELSRVDLRRLAASVIERFQGNVDYAANHELTLVGPEELIGTWDESRLDQVLTNLVSNALKYSPDGGPVTVVLERDGDNAVVQVRDEGLGIAEDRLGDLFLPFSRVHSDRRLVNGTGLGLYIAAQVIERHRGTIEVSSRLGAGTTFTVRLPIRALLDDEPGDVAFVTPALETA